MLVLRAFRSNTSSLARPLRSFTNTACISPSLPHRVQLRSQQWVPRPQQSQPSPSTSRWKRSFQSSSILRDTATPGGATIPPPPTSGVRPPVSRSRKWFRRGLFLVKAVGFLAGSTVIGVCVFTTGILAHDAFTYEEINITDVPVDPLALHPLRGGPKNLPILEAQVDCDESEEQKKLKEKPRLVILGSGWGSVGIIKNLNPGDYHVTVISPDTFTHFTPLLPSAAVGTVSVRSLVESLRRLLKRVHGHYLCGKAIDLVMSQRLVEVEVPTSEGKTTHVYVPYDKLIVAVGSVSAQHGVTGLENCFQLKTIADARNIRRRIMDNFEVAALPTTTPEERKRLLSFVICGGGPTGVETAAEISDLVSEDIAKYYPKLCRADVSIHIIQSRDHILNTYAEKISKYAEDRFARENVDLLTNARVKEVRKDRVIYTTRDPETKQTVEHEIPANFVLWSTGIAMNPFTQRVSDLLPNQVHKKAIVVDAHLRVNGAPLGTVYALGDASTLETNLLSYLLNLVDEVDVDRNGMIDRKEWEALVKKLVKKVPMSSQHLQKTREVFDLYDIDHDESLSLNELAALLMDIGNKMTALPATAQVASQQGAYIGKKLTKLAGQRETLLRNGVLDQDDESYADPFRYNHLGSLAYIGNAAAFELGNYSFVGGLAAMYAWRSVYWSEQVSWRTKSLLMVDWVVRGLFGRDLSKI